MNSKRDKIMKTIATIITGLLLLTSMSARADRTVVAKANNGSTDRMQLSSRIVLDLTKETPVLRNNSASIVYRQDAEILLQMDDLEDAIKMNKADAGKQETVYDLSGRKVSRPGKGIYIKGGKKVVLK